MCSGMLPEGIQVNATGKFLSEHADLRVDWNSEAVVDETRSSLGLGIVGAFLVDCAAYIDATSPEHKLLGCMILRFSHIKIAPVPNISVCFDCLVLQSIVIGLLKSEVELRMSSRFFTDLNNSVKPFMVFSAVLRHHSSSYCACASMER